MVESSLKNNLYWSGLNLMSTKKFISYSYSLSKNEPKWTNLFRQFLPALSRQYNLSLVASGLF